MRNVVDFISGHFSQNQTKPGSVASYDIQPGLPGYNTNTMKYLYSAYSHRVSRALRRH